MFLVTMGSHPTLPCPHVYIKKPPLCLNRTPRFKRIQKSKCSSQDLDLRGMKMDNYEVRERGKNDTREARKENKSEKLF